jgi:hypothetical protein
MNPADKATSPRKHGRLHRIIFGTWLVLGALLLLGSIVGVLFAAWAAVRVMSGGGNAPARIIHAPKSGNLAERVKFQGRQHFHPCFLLPGTKLTARQ